MRRASWPCFPERSRAFGRIAAASGDHRSQRDEFRNPSLVGGLLGALLLLFTPSSIFAGLVPWLVLFSTIVFAVGNFAPLEVIHRLKLGPRGALVPHFIISIYSGYFGGGIGFLMLAALTLFGMRDINAMNGLKMALVGVMTFTAIVVFVVADVVRWPRPCQ